MNISLMTAYTPTARGMKSWHASCGGSDTEALPAHNRALLFIGSALFVLLKTNLKLSDFRSIRAKNTLE